MNLAIATAEPYARYSKWRARQPRKTEEVFVERSRDLNIPDWI